MITDFSEDALVEQPAIALFKELGYETANCFYVDEEQEQKLEREFAREYHLITREDRLEKVAEDLVAHFMGRKQSGKGMVICIDKVTAVKMYDKVQKYWKAYLGGLKGKLAALPGSPQPAYGAILTGNVQGQSLAAEQPADFYFAKRQELQKQIEWMEQTDSSSVRCG